LELLKRDADVLVPYLQIGNPEIEALASLDWKMELWDYPKLPQIHSHVDTVLPPKKQAIFKVIHLKLRGH
jgi:hypothetical protein